MCIYLRIYILGKGPFYIEYIAMKTMCQQKQFTGRLHQADLRVKRVQMSATVTPRLSGVDTLREERIISGDSRKSANRGCIPTHLETSS